MRLANESKELFDRHEILGEDFHKMLLFRIRNCKKIKIRNYELGKKAIDIKSVALILYKFKR